MQETHNYPIRLPDGVVYHSAGCTTYPPNHQYSKMSRCLWQLVQNYPHLKQSIEEAVELHFLMNERELFENCEKDE